MGCRVEPECASVVAAKLTPDCARDYRTVHAIAEDLLPNFLYAARRDDVSVAATGEVGVGVAARQGTAAWKNGQHHDRCSGHQPESDPPRCARDFHTERPG
jgi:hypothetical protein